MMTHERALLLIRDRVVATSGTPLRSLCWNNPPFGRSVFNMTSVYGQ